MGVHSYIINVLMRTGDVFLTNEKRPRIALELYREASSLFPDSAICYIREAQCHILMVSITFMLVMLANIGFHVRNDLL